MDQLRSPAPVRAAVLAALFTAGCWTSRAATPAPVIANREAPTRSPAAPSPLAAEFGVFRGSGAFEMTDEIALYDGSLFGWRMQLDCAAGRPVRIREELRLPGPGAWSADPTLEISRDGHSARVRDEVACTEDGWVEKVWSVSAGDPPGTWVLRVTAEGFATQTFRATFDVP